MRNDPCGIIDKGDQIGLSLAASVKQHTGPMHDVTHPHFPGLLESKTPPIRITVLAFGFLHQSMAGE